MASIFERFWWTLGAKLRQRWRQVGLKDRWKINPKKLGRFHIALGTFQEAPERESLIFHWFSEIWVGGPRTWHGRASGGGSGPDPQIKIFQDKPNTTGTGTGPGTGTGTGTGPGTGTGTGTGAWCLTPTHTVAQSAVADTFILYLCYTFYF